MTFSDIRQNACILRAAIAIVLSAALVSCADESYPEPEPDAPESSADGARRYFSMRIMSADNSAVYAAGDNGFGNVSGSDLEHRLDVSGNSENVVIFFNNDWTCYGYTCIDYDGRFSQSTGTSYPAELAYIGVIHNPDPEELNNLPENGLMILNASGITEALDALGPDATIADVLALTDDATSGGRPGMSGKYHTMTSTAYLEPSDGEWKHSAIFKIDKSRLYDNRMQAQASPAATAIVERMSAKFSLTLPGASDQATLSYEPDGGRAQVIVCHYTDGQPNYNNRSWSCTVDAWGINKYETKSYYFRNIIGTGASTDSYPYIYGNDINTTGHPFYNGWNSAANRRAYWAVDPHYEDGIYPRQYRPAVDNTELDYYGFRGAPSLGYVSYDELSTDFSALGTEQGVCLYSSENTFPDTRIGGLWQHDLGASELVIGARIHIDRVNEDKEDYDLFRNRIGVFYPSVTDFTTYFIQTFNNQLASQSDMTYRYYDWDNPANNASGSVIKSLKLNFDNYKLYYGKEPLTPEKMAALAKCTMPATIENGDGKVIPWFEGIYIGRRGVDPNTHEEVGEVARLVIPNNDLKSIIYDWVGSFDHFNKGRMAYAVPVLHKATLEKVSDQAYRPSVGDYGVARNTWYSFALKSINTLGSPIDDTTQKIIIYQSSLENSILVETKVLEWHDFSTDVTLPDKLK